MRRQRVVFIGDGNIGDLRRIAFQLQIHLLEKLGAHVGIHGDREEHDHQSGQRGGTRRQSDSDGPARIHGVIEIA